VFVVVEFYYLYIFCKSLWNGWSKFKSILCVPWTNELQATIDLDLLASFEHESKHNFQIVNDLKC